MKTAITSKFNPLKYCALCLYRVGFGGRTIEALTGCNRSLVIKWAQWEGIKRTTHKKSRRYQTEELIRQKEETRRKRQAEREERRRQREQIEARKSGPLSPEEIERRKLEKSLKWKAAYRLNPDTVRRRAKEQWQKKKHDKEWKQRRYEANREWRKLNSERLVQARKQWVNKNRDKLKVYRRRHRSNPKNRALSNIRRRVRDFILKGKMIGSTQSLVGCSRDFLISHIESQFKGKMAWANYGKWHIDHIVPISKFDIEKENERKRACHWTNLQPLWAEDNMNKSDDIQNAQLGLMLTCF